MSDHCIDISRASAVSDPTLPARSAKFILVRQVHGPMLQGFADILTQREERRRKGEKYKKEGREKGKRDTDIHRHRLTY